MGKKQQTAPASDRLVVMLIDDQEIVAESIQQMLQEEGDIDFRYCSDPTEAIDRAIDINPTVILCDLVMPEVDGFTLLRFFRANEQTENIPVIVLSSKEDAIDKSDAFSAGASDYLVKLPERIELVARIRAHSRSYLAQKQRDAAYQEMAALQKQLEASNRELTRLSSLDGLTEIANRRYFDDHLDKEWRRSVRDKTLLALILIDVDYFKPFNDNYGHQRGDECLQHVAKALSHALQRPADFVARYGGEEFVVVLPETDARGAMQIAENLRAAVDALHMEHVCSKICDHVTISLGVACCSPDFQKPGDIIKAADQALYQAKERGRNQAVLWEKS